MSMIKANVWMNCTCPIHGRTGYRNISVKINHTFELIVLTPQEVSQYFSIKKDFFLIKS